MKATIDRVPDRKKPWRVRWRESSSPRSRYFATKKDAEEEVAVIKKRLGSGKLTPNAQETSLLFFLRSHAITPNDAIRILSTTGGSLRADEELGKALKAFLKDRTARGIRPATIDHYTRTLENFATGLDLKRPVSSLDPESVAKWITLRYSKESSRQTIRTPIAAFFNWSAGHGWCEEGFGKRIRWQKNLGDKQERGILTVEDTARLFKAAPRRFHAALALAAFAGIRPDGELQRLTWKDIHFDEKKITISGAISKTRDPRTLTDLPTNLWEWLKKTPKLRRKGRIAPCNYRNWRRAISAAREEAGITEWPKDVLRHNFASYGFHYKGVEWVIETLGHTNPKMLFKHYKGATNSTKAAEYFAIRP